MNVPAIRAALERLYEEESPVERAVIRVGLRACDATYTHDLSQCYDAEARLGAIADILREAGVEVEG